MNKIDRLINLVKTKGFNCNGMDKSLSLVPDSCNLCSVELSDVCSGTDTKTILDQERDRMNHARKELKQMPNHDQEIFEALI